MVSPAHAPLPGGGVGTRGVGPSGNYGGPVGGSTVGVGGPGMVPPHMYGYVSPPMHGAPPGYYSPRQGPYGYSPAPHSHGAAEGPRDPF